MATGAAKALLRIEAVSRNFGAVRAVEALSLEIMQGEMFALLGPSGCGKTTLLRMIAGFEKPDSGRLLLDGVDITALPPYRRPINMMFQSYALFPHLDVFGNIAFGLRRAGMEKTDIARRVQEMLALVRLEGLGTRRPDALSGGQRQRVALARALALRPRLLLLDEPLAALDRKLREETQFELMELQRRIGLTFLIVTHDQEEAMTLSSRMALMKGGRLVQVDTPEAIYRRPRNRFVADFIGGANIIAARVLSSDGRVVVAQDPASGESLMVASDARPLPEARVWLAVRAENLALGPPGAGQGANRLAVLVGEAAFFGDRSLVVAVRPDGQRLRIAVPHGQGMVPAPFAPGKSAVAVFDPAAAVLLADEQ